MIEVNVKKRLKHIHVNISFQFERNRVVVFGRSGSGKSTLLKMIAGFFDPQEGRIAFNGRVFFDSEKGERLEIFRRNVGYLPQSYTLFPNLSVRENILYGPKTRRLVWSDDKVSRIAERLGIARLLEKEPSRLSGGQRQRVALARVLMIQPSVLLLDEPFGALDIELRESLRELVSEICDDYGIPALFVTHDLEEAFTFGEELVIMENGHLIESGDLATVFNRPDYVESARLLGFMNIWRVIRGEEQRVILENSRHLVVDGGVEAGTGYACIRNGQVMILRDDRPINRSLKENVFSGKVALIRHRGNYVYLLFRDSEGFSLHINIPVHAFEKMDLEKGKAISVSLKRESIVLCQSKFPDWYR